MKVNFTERIVYSLRRENLNNPLLNDAVAKHLWLKVNQKSKRWYHIESFNGERKEFLLGEFPEMSVDEARTKSITFDPEMVIEDNQATMSVADVFQLYYERKASKTSAARQVLGIMNNYIIPRLSKVRVAAFSTIDVEDWHRSITTKNGPVIANRCLAYLRAAYNYCIKREIIETNPTMTAEINKEESRTRFLSKKEMGRFLNNLGAVAEIHRDIIKVLLFTGQRKSQVLAMRWDEIDVDSCMWHSRVKGGKAVSIPLTNEVMRILERRFDNRKEGKSYVFYQHGYRDGHVKNMEVAWEKVRKATGIEDVTIHDLRRTLASWQVQNGEGMKVVQDTLTHSSQASTEVYAHLDNETVRDSVERTVAKMMEAVKEN